MKKSFSSKLVFIVTILFGVIALCGCNKSEDENTERVVILNIASALVYDAPAPPALPESPANVPCMLATEAGSQARILMYIGRIEGFEYEEGYEYNLKVLITELSNPPADGFLETYKLIEILSKNKVQE